MMKFKIGDKVQRTDKVNIGGKPYGTITEVPYNPNSDYSIYRVDGISHYAYILAPYTLPTSATNVNGHGVDVSKLKKNDVVTVELTVLEKKTNSSYVYAMVKDYGGINIPVSAIKSVAARPLAVGDVVKANAGDYSAIIKAIDGNTAFVKYTDGYYAVRSLSDLKRT